MHPHKWMVDLCSAGKNKQSPGRHAAAHAKRSPPLKATHPSSIASAAVALPRALQQQLAPPLAVGLGGALPLLGLLRLELGFVQGHLLDVVAAVHCRQYIGQCRQGGVVRNPESRGRERRGVWWGQGEGQQRAATQRRVHTRRFQCAVLRSHPTIASR